MSLLTATRKLVAEIKSPDVFETLATSVLRAARPAYSALIHVGTNADGRTVRSPIDGIDLRIHRGSRRLLLIQHTITAKQELRRKWLAPEDGDLAKAKAIAGAERERGAVREATLVLCSSMDPDQELIRDVNAAAGDDLAVDIWSGSRIADFLDRDPEGQWLREQEFGTNAVRLSASQARDIARHSLAAYLPLVPRNDIVDRMLDPLLTAFAREARGAGFVIGESGLGKSAALRRLGDQWLADGGIALVLDHTIIEQTATIEQAITLGLRKWTPALDTRCGQVALSLSTPEHPLLLIVEDINLAPNPRRIIERILAWSGVGQKGGIEIEWRLLCPVWRGNAGLGDSRLRGHVLSRSLAVDRFEPDEAVAAVSTRALAAGVTLTRLQAVDLAAALGNDPLLIGLNSDWETASPRDAIQSYVEAQIDDAADDRLLASDLRSALDCCAERMVAERNIAPSWDEIRTWHAAGTDCLAGLRRLLDQGRILRLGADERLTYRHDRVRDHLLVHGIVRLIDRGRFSPDLWSDPYYAGLIGVALTILPPGRIDDALTLNPVALFAALQYSRLDDDRQTRLIAAAQQWAASPGFRNNASESLRSNAMRYLMRTDAPFVRQLATRFDTSFWKLEALARNGHAGAAAALCQISGPGVHDSWRDRIISHALARYSKFVDDVIGLLAKPEVKGEQLEGVLNLAGEIGDPRLCNALATRWAAMGAAGLTAGWLWAALRCCPPIGHPLVDEVCRAWGALPSKLRGKDRDRNPRWDVAGYSLPWGLSRKPDSATLAYLIALQKRHRGLMHVVGKIISHIDLPDAVVWSARRAASIDRGIEGKGSVNLWWSSLDQQWKPERNGRALSAASRAALARLWRDRRVNRLDRQAAFRIWALSPTTTELADLPALEADPILADQVLQTRVAAGDQAAVPLLRQRLWTGERGWVWWYQARRVGLAGLEDDIRRFFAVRRSKKTDGSDHIVAELLMDSRSEFAAAVIIDNWDQLSDSPDFVQAALYLATPETIALGRAAVMASNRPLQMLDHFNMHWGIRVFDRPGVTDVAQLKGLEPLLKIIREGEFGEMRLGDLFDAANRLGALAWRKQHLDPLMTAGWFGCPSDRDALYATLDAEVQHAAQLDRNWLKVDHWFERREKELLKRDALLELIADWAIDRGSERAVRLLCEALIRFGERRDLIFLDRLPPHLHQSCATTIANCTYEVRRRSL